MHLLATFYWCFRNMYVCPPDDRNEAKHISVAANNVKYRLQYKNYAGGVTAVSKSQACIYYIILMFLGYYIILILSLY